ncbi:general secretion pathway protein GspK [Profundibacterium mesophilum]|uniref:Type II secretion system protein K n=1 Tax=Profundibacterium mesophilum KAUST100406-0324 TaxID=1037889 RepID=A0A921NSQ1_9RHOB|nr:type II secretion system protein GspK [Profundibacterium mesophilum]KAF0675829.1 Type II secretion system protein K [Profundibacterium mesophilum KAUST100406-0324]
MTSRPREGEQGIVLVNVLVILTLAASVVYLMISTQDFAIEGVRLRASAAQVDALLSGGELSAITALRRDMRTAPEADHRGEPWAGIAQSETVLAGGARFALEIEDLQSRYDINRLAGRNFADIAFFGRLAALAGLSPEQSASITELVRARNGIADIGALSAAGLGADEIARLEPYLVALGGEGLVNLNTVGAGLLTLLISNPPAAERLIRIRERRGALRDDDLANVGVVRPALAGWTSQDYRVTVTAELDGLRRSRQSDLHRITEPAPGDVIVTARRAAALDVAALPEPAAARALLSQ